MFGRQGGERYVEAVGFAPNPAIGSGVAPAYQLKGGGLRRTARRRIAQTKIEYGGLLLFRYAYSFWGSERPCVLIFGMLNRLVGPSSRMTVGQLHSRGISRGMTSGPSQANDAGGSNGVSQIPAAQQRRRRDLHTATCRETLVGAARLAKGWLMVGPYGRVGPVEDARLPPKQSCKWPVHRCFSVCF